jgi:hypothetical protein
MCKYQSVEYDSNDPKENAMLGVRNERYLIATKKIAKNNKNHSILWEFLWKRFICFVSIEVSVFAYGHKVNQFLFLR